MKQRRIYITIGILLIAAFAIYHHWNSDRHFYDLLDKEGIYTIGTIVKVEELSKGGPLSDVSYSYRNKQYEGKYIGDLSAIQKPLIGNRFFIEIIPNNPKIGIYFSPHWSVPDSITVAPSNGWSQAWMKENFPDCVR